ncbi:hypothetical protein NC652_035169 [Populus alba x Populus x berolinensis]|nr:hypothetical protein NC652_035169 [Populus alba x Populus x berolinensis]
MSMHFCMRIIKLYVLPRILYRRRWPSLGVLSKKKKISSSVWQSTEVHEQSLLSCDAISP